MEEWLHTLAHNVALALNALAVLVVLVGAAEALVAIVRVLVFARQDQPAQRAVWLRFARWLIAALTFQLGADIVETTIAPTWDDIGRVAAIAVIRTFLTYFLDRDIEAVRDRRAESAHASNETEGETDAKRS